MDLISEPGLYALSEEIYHSDPVIKPSLSSSIIKTITNKTLRHAWAEHPRLNWNYEPVNKNQFDFGKAAHTLMLQDEPKIEVLDFNNYQTKAAKEARDGAWASGKTPILEKEYELLIQMVTAGRDQISQHEDASTLFDEEHGVAETNLVWNEIIDDQLVWCRCRIDWWDKNGPFFADYKTTSSSAHPNDIEKTIFRLGYDIQAAFYRRGIERVLGIHDPEFLFVFHEKSPPYALSVDCVAPDAIEIANYKVERAMRKWAHATKHDHWPGYSSRTAYISAPGWMLHNFENMKMNDSLEAEASDDAGVKGITWDDPDWEDEDEL